MVLTGLIEFYLDNTVEDEETTDEYLKRAGIDPAETKNRILELIENHNAKAKINNGKILQEKFQKIKDALINNPEFAQRVKRDLQLSFSYRSLTELTKADEETFAKLVALLDQIEKERGNV